VVHGLPANEDGEDDSEEDGWSLPSSDGSMAAPVDLPHSMAAAWLWSGRRRWWRRAEAPLPWLVAVLDWEGVGERILVSAFVLPQFKGSKGALIFFCTFLIPFFCAELDNLRFISQK
jgi:hypothetical protein